ncbi:uncharacterized protein MalAC0309_2063 [Microcella alkaliphila]|uniref:Uncharacterized protein n=1 Tax=Microcella alkaliphila TaxID=279828 RepID=A0A0U5BQL2_9MICO|nr:hypothetical protein [Microcella alkaliphila]BAU32908.1 uncharacterized protein MalAC0309_2063 [Microcella alkaliphila]
MQLGTRWAVGDTPPPQLTPEVVAAIHRVEGELLGFDTTQWRWTLTWLEGRPVVQLDDGTTIRVSPSGRVHVSNEDDADELDR